MATYIYETIPQEPGETPVRFEIQQSMRDDALTRHPETGAPVRRVVTGGFGIMAGTGGAKTPATNTGGGCCSGAFR
jgi:predicted nucleic acid-binding Zn ribbon protein